MKVGDQSGGASVQLMQDHLFQVTSQKRIPREWFNAYHHRWRLYSHHWMTPFRKMTVLCSSYHMDHEETWWEQATEQDLNSDYQISKLGGLALPERSLVIFPSLLHLSSHLLLPFLLRSSLLWVLDGVSFALPRSKEAGRLDGFESRACEDVGVSALDSSVTSRFHTSICDVDGRTKVADCCTFPTLVRKVQSWRHHMIGAKLPVGTA